MIFPLASRSVCVVKRAKRALHFPYHPTGAPFNMKRLVTVLAFALVCALYFGPSVSALVTNGDFETGTFGGWTKSTFINNGLSQPYGVGGNDLSAIVGGPGVLPLSLSDPRSNNNLRYPAYGNYSARVNSVCLIPAAATRGMATR